MMTAYWLRYPSQVVELLTVISATRRSCSRLPRFIDKTRRAPARSNRSSYELGAAILQANMQLIGAARGIRWGA
jgi:hypothetical protein